MSKVVVAGRSEPKCRICQSGKREVWERAFEDYINGADDRVSGDKLTWEKLAERASVLAGETVSVRSCRRHSDGHVRVTGEARAEELEEQAEEGDELLDGVLAEIDGLLEAGETVSPTGLLSLQQRLYLLSLRDRLQRGDVPALTHDQAARASTAMLTAAKRHQEGELLAALTGGIGQVFQKALSAPAALEAGEVVDAEVIAEEDAAA